MAPEAESSRVLALVFTDLVESTGLKFRLGDQAAGKLVERHHELVRKLLLDCHGREVDSAGDGFFLTFETPSSAVTFGLRLQAAHDAETDLPPVRVGIHLGEVSDRAAPEGSPKPRLVEGLAVDVAARIQSLAQPGQVLMSTAVFDSARQRVEGGELLGEIDWRAYGPYLFKGSEHPVEICEAGRAGASPLKAPPDSEKARSATAADDELTLGWRPAAGKEIPGREHWTLLEQLGTGAVGEVWLATHAKTHGHRVFKFCFDPNRLRGLKREVALLRLLHEKLGERPDIGQILDWEFDSPPFFLEMPYTEAVDLQHWAQLKGGIEEVELETRVEIAAQIADALAAAHAVAVLHKDLKPANILISEPVSTEVPRVCLTDFGIGLLTDREALSSAGVTSGGLSETLFSDSGSSSAGTRLYMAPEVIEGRPATERSDVYSLGVVLYQLVSGDLSHALAPGWRRDVEDALLREDVAACVDGDPERRLASAAELATRLRDLPARRLEAETVRQEQKRGESARGRRRWWFRAAIAIPLLVLVVGLVVVQQSRLQEERHQAERARWAREEGLPQLRQLIFDAASHRAFELAQELERWIPEDTVLQELVPKISVVGSVGSEPPGAEVSVRPYESDAAWRVLGVTPLEGVRFARDAYQWRFEKPGFETRVLAAQAPDDALIGSRSAADDPHRLEPFSVPLLPEGTTPEGMVHVPEGKIAMPMTGFNVNVPLDVGAYLIDRLETSNAEYQEFVDGGGYNAPELWAELLDQTDNPVSESVAPFVDSTGRPGPAHWVLGQFPEGAGELPVSGISWFEAAAYCRFRDKQLPTVYHWARAAVMAHEIIFGMLPRVMQASPLDIGSPVPVGTSAALGRWGAREMTGNVREWAANAAGEGRFALGGAATDRAYFVTLPPRPLPDERRRDTGVRCMRPLGEVRPSLMAARPAPRAIDHSATEPVSDEVFAGFLRQLEYTDSPLEARIEERTEGSHWIREKVSFATAYDAERTVAYIHLPRRGVPPFRTIVVWPGAQALGIRDGDSAIDAHVQQPLINGLLRGGSAIVVPVVIGMWQRPVPCPETWFCIGLVEGPDGVERRDYTRRDYFTDRIQWKQLQDLHRTVDYLETREDMDTDRLGFLGTSWGGTKGPFLVGPKAERFRASVLLSASGFSGSPAIPERYSKHWAQRLKVPTLSIVGNVDFLTPIEQSVRPFIEMLPIDEKRLVVVPGGHIEPYVADRALKEASDWFDTYLGPASTQR